MNRGKTIVLCGSAGVGKDTAGDFLVRRRGYVRVGLADPLKRFCQEVFAFTDDQLWGPSASRNAPDPRYPRPCHPCRGEGRVETVAEIRPATFENGAVVPQQVLLSRQECIFCRGEGKTFLSPREALQTLGTDWGRRCYPDTWIELGRRTAREHNDRGVSVVVTDARFRNELEGFKADGAVLVRLYRPGAGLGGAAAAHPSEAELRDLPDSLFDALVQNAYGLDDLARAIERVAGES